jgi:hypothetical protein
MKGDDIDSHIVCEGEMRNSFKVGRKPERKILFGGTRYRWRIILKWILKK